MLAREVSAVKHEAHQIGHNISTAISGLTEGIKHELEPVVVVPPPGSPQSQAGYIEVAEPPGQTTTPAPTATQAAPTTPPVNATQTPTSTEVIASTPVAMPGSSVTGTTADSGTSIPVTVAPSATPTLPATETIEPTIDSSQAVEALPTSGPITAPGIVPSQSDSPADPATAEVPVASAEAQGSLLNLETSSASNASDSLEQPASQLAAAASVVVNQGQATPTDPLPEPATNEVVSDFRQSLKPSLRSLFSFRLHPLGYGLTLLVIVLIAGLGIHGLLAKKPAVNSPISSQTDKTLVSTPIGSLNINRPTIITGGNGFLATGPAVFRNQSNSTSALAVQDTSGNNVFSVDSKNVQVKLGDTVLNQQTLSNINNLSNSLNQINNRINSINQSSTLPPEVTLLGNSFNGADELVQLNGAGALPAISGVNLTALNASNIDSGTLADARLSSSVTLQGNSFNGADELVLLNGSGALPAISGANLTNLNASSITSGTLSDNRLSANVALLNGSGPQTFTGNNKFTGTVLAQNAVNSTAAFQVQNASSNPVLTVDTSNSRVAIAQSTANYPLDVHGDVNTDSTFKVNGVTVCDSGGCAVASGSNNYIQNQSAVTQTADFKISGTATAGFFSGDGVNLTNLDASNIAIGTLTDNRLTSNVPLKNAANLFTATNTFDVDSASALRVQNAGGTINTLVADTNNTRVAIAQAAANYTLDVNGDINITTGHNFRINGTSICDASGCTPAAGSLNYISLQGATPGSAQTGNGNITGTFIAGNFSGGGSALTSLNATQLTSGTVNDTRLSGNVTLQGNSFNGASQLVQLNGSTQLPGVSGVNLTNLNGSNIASGTVADARLSANVALLDGSQTYSGHPLFKNTVDDVNAFRIQDSAGGQVLTADTTSDTVTVNNLTVTGTCSGCTGSSGANAALSNLSGVAINTSLLPGTAGAINLGSAAKPFGDIFLAGTSGTPGTNNFKITGASTSGLRTITLPDQSGTVTVQGNTFNGASQLVQLNGSTQLPAVSGVNLTNLNASNIASGTLSSSRLDTDVTLQGNSFNGASQLVQLTAGGILPVLSGANLTNLNASNIASGTLDDARLSANVALLNGSGPQIFSGNNKFSGTVLVNNSSASGFQVQNASNNEVLTVDTSSNQVVLGKASTLSGKIVYKNAGSTGVVNLVTADAGTGNSYTVTLPAENGTVCTTASVCSGYAPGSGGSGYVQLQGSTPGSPQTGHFNITGTGIAGTLEATNFDTASATTLALGNGNATATSICNSAACDTVQIGTNTDADAIQIGDGNDTVTLTGNSSSTIVLNGSTISAAELNLLDGHDVALVDTNDAVSTAITGTGALNSGSITGGFGSIDTGADNITTTGTVQGSTSVLTNLLDTPASGALAIGTTNATAINLNQNTSVSGSHTFVTGTGSVSLNGDTTVASGKNFTQSGGGTFSTGTGTVSLNGATTVASGKSFTANGSALFQINSDSATALQVKNAGGTQLLNIDTTADGANLDTNGSLEINTTGYSAYGGATLSRTTSQKYLGQASLQVATTAAANDGLQYPVSLSNTTTYSLTIFAKASGSNFSTLEIGRAEDGSTDTSCLTSQTVVTGGWTRFTCSFTTGTTSGSPYVYVKQTDASSRTFYVDALKLEAATAPTPYRESALAVNGLLNSALTLQATADSTNAFGIQTAAGVGLLTADTLNGSLTLGTASSLTGNLVFASAGGSGLVTLSASNGSGTNYAIVLPNANGTVCLTSGNCAGVGGTGDVLQGGNSFGTALTLGTNDNFGLNLEVNNTTVASFTNTGQALFKNTSDSTTAFRVQNNTGKNVLSLDTSNGLLTLGNSGASGVTGDAKFLYSGQTGSISLVPANPTSTDYTLTLPAENGTLCSTGSVCAGYAASGGSTGYIQNQSSSDQTADFRISGTGRANTSFTTPNLDAVSAGALGIGNLGTATSVSICNSANCDTINLGTNADADAINIGDSLDTLTLTGGSSSTLVLNGTTISAAELNLLDGHDVALVDTNDAVSTAIVGTGALDAGSITGGFGSIDTGADNITTTGTVSGNNFDRSTTGSLTFGNTNASAISLCNSAACDTIDIGTNADADSISIGDSLDTLTLTGNNSSTIALNGTTISAAELNLLDGHDVALVDTNDAVNTAITGTGALTSGSIGSGFGNISTGNTITTTGTVGTAATTTFTGANATFSGTVNLGTVGAGTAASTVHIADTSDGTGTQTVTIGSTAKAADALTLQGGSSGGVTIINGSTNIGPSELNLLDGHDVALVDTNDAVTTAIVGTGALDSGSITANFGAINVGADNITTTGTVNGNTIDRSTAGILTIGSTATSISLNKNASVSGSNTFDTGTGAVGLNGDVTVASGKNFSQSGAGTFSTGTGTVSLQGNTTVSAGKSLSLASGAGTFTQTYTGTSTDAHSITANSLTTASALKVTSSNNSSADSAWSAISLNVTNAQDTTAVSTGQINGLDLQFTQNPAIAGNTEYAANLAISQNDSSATDSTVSAILNLSNNDTATGNQITAAKGLQINGGNVTDGLYFNGTFGTNLINSSTGNFVVTQAGAITGASLNTSSGSIVTTGTVGSAGNTTFTGAGATFSGTVNANAATALATSQTGTIAVFNTNATTVNAFGAASTINLAAAGATIAGPGNLTIQQASGSTLNLGNTGGASAVSVRCGTGACGFGDNSTDHSSTFGSNTGTSATTIQSGSGGISLAGNTTISGTNTFTTGTGNVTLKGNVSIDANKTFIQNGSGTFDTGTGAVGLNGNTTIASGKSFTFNGETFTDLTGNGLTDSSNALTVQVAASADALSSTTSSGSGLEVLSSGVALLQGCSDTQILKWDETLDVWKCAADNNSGGSSTLQNVYDNSSTPALITLATGKNIEIDSPDVATDPNIVFDLQCATCSAGGGQFQVDNAGTVVLSVKNNSSSTAAVIVQPKTNSTRGFEIQNAAGTSNLFIADTTNTRIGIGLTGPAYTLDVAGDTNITGAYRISGTSTLSGTALTFVGASTATIQPASGQALTITAHGTSTWSTDSGNLTVDAAGALNLGTANSTSTSLGKSGTTLTVNPTSWTATPTISGLITATSGLTSNGTVTVQNNSNFSQTGSGTFGTGTGTVSLNGATTVATDKAFQANGTATFTDATNATTAFRVQNAGAINVVQVDNTTDSANLITNGSFEVNTTGWSAEGSSTLSRTTSSPTPYIGLGQLKVVTTAVANDGAKYPVSLSSTTDYTLTGYVRLDSGSNAMATLELGRAEDGSTDTSCLTGQTVVTGGWTRFSCSFTTGTTSGSPYIYFKQTDGTIHTYYLDAVKLEAATSASGYREGVIYLNGNVGSPLNIKNQSDSTRALQIQNAAGTANLFIADTLNSKIGIGLQPSASGAALQVTGSVSGSTSLLSPSLDVISAGALAIGNSTATSVSLCNSAACDTISIGTNTDADTINIGDSNDTLTLTGNSSSTIVLNGSTISAAELNLLDGHDVALVDTNDAVATAIVGTGALDSGSITANFGAIDVGADNITTTGTVNGNTIDRSTAGALTIGSTATSISLNKNTTVSGSNTFGTGTGAVSLNGDTTIAAGKNLSLASGAGTLTQTSTATTTDATTITANSLTTGNAAKIAFTQNAAAAAGSTASGLNIAAAQPTNTGNTTDLLNLNVAGTNGTINGIAFTGTDTNFTNLIKATNFSVSGAGAIVGVGVNSGSGLIQGTGGETTTGTIQLNASGTGNTTIGNTAGGTITIGGTSGSNLILQDADWNISGAGAATLASITNNGTYNGNTFTSTRLAFSAASTATVDSAASQSISIGDTNATGVTLGNTTNTTSISLQGAAAANYTIGDTNTTGTITLGRSTATNTISIGSAAVADTKTQTISIGNGNAVGGTSGGVTVNIAAGTPGSSATNTIHIGDGGTTTGTVAITIGSNGAAAHTLVLQGGNGTGGSAAVKITSQAAGDITIGNTAQTGTLTLGSSSASNTVNIANGSGAGTVAIANVQTAGSVAVGAGMTTGTITIGGSSQTGTITLGKATTDQTISIGDAQTADTKTNTINIGTSATATGKAVVTIGNTNGASALTLKAGSGDINLTLPAATDGADVIISSTADNNASLLIVDKDGNATVGTAFAGSNEPTCTSGGVYYTSDNHFRGCENGTWANLVNYADVQSWCTSGCTASGTGNKTWTKPNGVTSVLVIICGGGGQGGGGATGSNAGTRRGGSGGGGGACYSKNLLASEMSTSSGGIVVGAGGTGSGTGGGTGGAAGNAGAAGGDSSVKNTAGDTILKAQGGGAGAGGNASSNNVSGGGGGGIGNNTTTPGNGSTSAASGGGPTGTTNAAATGTNGGGNDATGTVGHAAEFGGGGGGGVAASGSAKAGGTSLYGGGGGGAAGAGGSSSNAGTAGGGVNTWDDTNGGGGGSAGASGNNAGGVGAAGNSTKGGQGGGGGGGTTSSGATANNGGAGGQCGGGGGGGGGAVSGGTGTGGTGGVGGDGCAYVISF